jgi:hypothetical protein
MFLSQQLKVRGKEMEQNLIMLQGLSCLFISAKNYEMDPTVPSSKKFLRQLPGYVPTQREKKFDDQAYQYGMGQVDARGQSQRFDARKNELCEQEQYVLNLIAFDLDTYPVFYDIIDLFMTQGLIYTGDQMMSNG